MSALSPAPAAAAGAHARDRTPPTAGDIEEGGSGGQLQSVSAHKRMPRKVENEELRVLFVTATYFVLDGVSLTIRRLEAHLESIGAQVRVMTTVPDTVTAEELEDHIIPVPGVKIPWTHAGTGYQFGAGLDENTMREMERFAPNIVHFTVPDLVGIDAVRWCRENNVPTCCTWHSNYADYLKYYFVEWWFKPPFLRYLISFYSMFRSVYVPTPFIRRKMMQEGFGADKDNSECELKIWGRGVDLELFSPVKRSSAFRAARSIEEDDVVLLWVGRIVPEKRPEIWVEVMERLLAEGYKVKGIVVGDGSFESMMGSLPNVSCTGWLSGNDLATAYASCDILLFPSAVETFGNVTLEALASGVACVVEENCGGHLVQNSFNGYTIEADNTEAFYRATAQLVRDQELRRNMQIRARESAYEWRRETILQQMAENYKEAIVELERYPYSEDSVDLEKHAECCMCLSYHNAQKLCNPIATASARVQDAIECVMNFSGDFPACWFLCPAVVREPRTPTLLRHDSTGSRAQAMSVSRFMYLSGVAMAYLLVAVFIVVSFGFL